ncbi:AraC-like DNA-binding protein [Filimonas zeae]|uniref:AraC family transcriptional regulator n=1 Tax=Filimonas zeae TaxID=1737353 RepID=A0A917MWY1_9BACT|nr:AraC family transcriptional regulator [Filimonas zeae]MDR6340425.1 AraC-like DNA-binding protein [Filimonas zeae]GGH72671.1 AraC family transcriptional regulator [Filimonas zeae]
MYQFHYQQGAAGRLDAFPHILEIYAKKNTAIQLQSFPQQVASGLCIYYIQEGKFEWFVNGKHYFLFPGDTVLVLPGDTIGNDKGILELGCIWCLQLNIPQLKQGELQPGAWSGLSATECAAVGKLLHLKSTAVLSRMSEAGRILSCLFYEIHHLELAYVTRVNQLIDELIVAVTRQLTRQCLPARDFSSIFMKLEDALRKDLSHQWTVEEMAAIAGMGTTLFTEKVKGFTGFTPINYLINIRISEATRLLKRREVSITDIALDTGFYSSQHFSTTFKKLTGYTPGEFRKNNTYTE